MRYLFLDLKDILNEKESKIPPLLFSSKGVNIRLSQARLKMLRSLLKQHPKLQVVLAPACYTKLSLLDYRTMFETFRVDPSRILIVDTEIFSWEEEMAQVFRVQEFLTYHRKSNEDFKFLISEADVHKATKLDYLRKHIPELSSNTIELPLEFSSFTGEAV